MSGLVHFSLLCFTMTESRISVKSLDMVVALETRTDSMIMSHVKRNVVNRHHLQVVRCIKSYNLSISIS
jgi:hypothetical protein